MDPETCIRPAPLPPSPDLLVLFFFSFLAGSMQFSGNFHHYFRTHWNDQQHPRRIPRRVPVRSPRTRPWLDEEMRYVDLREYLFRAYVGCGANPVVLRAQASFFSPFTSASVVVFIIQNELESGFLEVSYKPLKTAASASLGRVPTGAVTAFPRRSGPSPAIVHVQVEATFTATYPIAAFIAVFNKQRFGTQPLGLGWGPWVRCRSQLARQREVGGTVAWHSSCYPSYLKLLSLSANYSHRQTCTRRRHRFHYIQSPLPPPHRFSRRSFLQLPILDVILFHPLLLDFP